MIRTEQHLYIEKKSEENIKHAFWQIDINDQKPSLKIKINNIGIKGLLDIKVDITIILPKSWHLGCFLQEINMQFLGTGTFLGCKNFSGKLSV